MSAALASPSRRRLLAGAGSLVFAFSLRPVLAQEAQGGQPPPPAPGLPGSLKQNAWLDSWIRIDADGSVTVKTGKAELGQGIKTAILQVAAEELRIEPHRLKLITADTSETANEGYTAGSHSMQDSATAIRNAAAQVRELLAGLAAARLGAEVASLTVADGVGYPEARSVQVKYSEAGLSPLPATCPGAPGRAHAEANSHRSARSSPLAFAGAERRG